MSPLATLKVRLTGVAAKLEIPIGFTVRVTGTVVLFKPDEIEINPVYGPGVSDPGFADTVTLAGVLPDAGVTASQLLPENEAKVKPTDEPPLEVTMRFWVPAGPPADRVKVSLAGDTLSAVCADDRLARPKKTKRALKEAMVV